MRVRHHLDHMGDVVENNKRVRDHEEDIRDIETLLVAARQIFKEPDHVVAHKPHGPAEKTREGRVRHGFILGEYFFYRIKGVPVK